MVRRKRWVGSVARGEWADPAWAERDPSSAFWDWQAAPWAYSEEDWASLPESADPIAFGM